MSSAPGLVGINVHNGVLGKRCIMATAHQAMVSCKSPALKFGQVSKLLTTQYVPGSVGVHLLWWGGITYGGRLKILQVMIASTPTTTHGNLQGVSCSLVKFRAFTGASHYDFTSHRRRNHPHADSTKSAVGRQEPGDGPATQAAAALSHRDPEGTARGHTKRSLLLVEWIARKTPCY